jgi:hypothetical protein
MARPSHTKSHLPGNSPPEPGRPPCWTSHLAFGLIVSNMVIFPKGIREKNENFEVTRKRDKA